MIDRNTLMNGSTNASIDQYNKNQSSDFNSLKSKSKVGSEFGLRIRNQTSQGNRKRVDKNKEYINQIINNNCFIDNSLNYNNRNFSDNNNKTENPKAQKDEDHDYYLKQPSFEGIEVNLNNT